MANVIFPKKLSRRTMLAGGVAIVAPLVPPILAGRSNDDDKLLNLVAAAEQCWVDFVAVWELREHLLREIWRDPDCPRMTKLSLADRAKFNEISERTGYRDAADCCGDLHDFYGEAMQMAFCIPAQTLPGLQAKMKLATDVARIGDSGAYTKTEFEWLDIAMADFERLVNQRPPRSSGI